MKTGKIKQAICFTLFLGFTTLHSWAQLTTGTISMSGATIATAPVDLKLAVTIKNNTVEISWKALKQITVRRYELEKSTDGDTYNYVTAVSGNYRHLTNYSVQDRNLMETINYYRLKIVAADGNYHYSKIVLLDATSRPSDIKILPTQVNQKLFIWLPANTSISDASINDVAGRNVLPHTTINNTTNLAEVEISKLPVGLYQINLITNKGEMVRLKFSKGN